MHVLAAVSYSYVPFPEICARLEQVLKQSVDKAAVNDKLRELASQDLIEAFQATGQHRYRPVDLPAWSGVGTLFFRPTEAGKQLQAEG